MAARAVLQLGASAEPREITAGPNHRWLTERGGDAIGTRDPAAVS